MPNNYPNYLIGNGLSGWYTYAYPNTQSADLEWFELLVKGLAEVLLKVKEELTKAQAEPDEAYRERLERDIKAQGYEKIHKFLESVI